MEDFDSRPHKAVSVVVEREKEMQEWNAQKLPKVLPGDSEGCQEEALKNQVEEEEEEEKGSREKQIGYEIAQKVVAGIKEKANGHGDAQSTAQRTVGQSVKQSWECRRGGKRKTGQRETRWTFNGREDGKMEESLERIRIGGSSLQAEVMQKVPELVVHERMSQIKGVCEVLDP